MIYEGLLSEGIAVVKGVRDRHDGIRRNPWDEFECGNHYARSMASYSLLLALSGFRYSAPEKRLGFNPVVSEDNFACFFSVEAAWGVLRQQMAGSPRAMVEVRKGTLSLQQVQLGFQAGNVEIHVAGHPVSAEIKDTDSGMTISFTDLIEIKTGETLLITTY